MEYIKINDTTYIKSTHVNKRRNHLPVKVGRPKASDYLVRMPAKQRAEINKKLHTVEKSKDSNKTVAMMVGAIICISLFNLWLSSSDTYTGTGITEPIKIVEAESVESKEETIEDMICNPNYEWDCKTMIAIFKSENGYQLRGGWKPSAKYEGNTNGSTDTGIAMINSIYNFKGDLTDPKYNIECAYKVWLSQGYEAWSDYNNSKYLKYL